MSNTEALARAVIHARDTYGWSPEVDAAIEALRAALAQPAADVPEARFGNMPAASGEPVAYSIGRTLHWHEGKGRTNAQLYAAPQPAPARVPQWQPIETAPKDGSLFLCWVSAVRYGETDEGQQFQQDASQADFCSWRDGPSDLPGHGYLDPCCGQIGDSQDVTHWMPLPAAPTPQEPTRAEGE